MFDQHHTNYHNETVVTPITQIIEKTISPNKVTDMYDKVMDEVKKTIVRSFIIKDSRCEFSVVVFEDANTMSFELNARYLINGEEILMRQSVDPIIMRVDSMESQGKLIQLVYESYRTKLANIGTRYTIENLINKKNATKPT